jgi:hypothetical protein
MLFLAHLITRLAFRNRFTTRGGCRNHRAAIQFLSIESSLQALDDCCKEASGYAGQSFVPRDEKEDST